MGVTRVIITCFRGFIGNPLVILQLRGLLDKLGHMGGGFDFPLSVYFAVRISLCGVRYGFSLMLWILGS